MAATPEGRVKAAIKKHLQSLAHCWWCVPNAGGYGVAGIPDFLVCYRGFFLAIEAKKPGNVKGTTTLQEMQLKALNNAMGFGIVADDVETVKTAIHYIDTRLEAMGRRGGFEPQQVVSRL